MVNFDNTNALIDDDCTYLDDMPVKATKHGDTLEAATKKVLAQLAANKAFLEGATEALEVPAVFKEVQGEYVVGAKCSNKYLYIFSGGKHRYARLKSKQACIAKLGEVMANVKAGHCNIMLRAAIANNIAMHKAAKERKALKALKA